MADALPGSELPAEGFRLGQPFSSKVQVLLGGLLVTPFGGAMFWAWWAGVMPAKAGVVGGIVCLMGVAMIPAGILKLFRNRELILGADEVKIVGDNDKVELRVPYKNITRVDLVTDKAAQGGSKFIAAKLVDPREPDTVLRPVVRINGEWDCRLLENSWPVPLEMICDWLEAKIGQSTEVDPTEHVRWER